MEEEGLGRKPALGHRVNDDLGSIGSVQVMPCIPASGSNPPGYGVSDAGEGSRRLCWCIASVAGQGNAGSWSVLGTASFWGSLRVNAREKNHKTITWNKCRTRVLKSTTRSFLEVPAGAASLHCSSASCPGRQGGGLDASPLAPRSSFLDPPSCPGKGRHLPVLGSA